MNIKDWSVDTFWKGEVCVQGLVEDGTEQFKTKIFVRGSQIYDYSCSCAEGNSYRGVCEHGKALFAEYQKRQQQQRRIPVFTSTAVRTMIREYTNREVARIVGEEEEGDLQLVPRLLIHRDGISMECRILGKKQYLIQDLIRFAEAVRTGKRLEYGKNLAFEHRISAFAPESRPLLHLILSEAGAYEQHYGEIRTGAAAHAPALRAITLNPAVRDQLFSMLEGEYVQAEDYMGHERRLLVLRENPAFTVKAEELGPEGIRITVPADLMPFSGEHLLYVADENCLYGCDAEYTERMSVFLSEVFSERERASGDAPGTLLVNRRDIPLFYARVLSGFEELGILESSGVDFEEYKPCELRASFLFDRTGPSEVVMRPTLSYGDFSFHPLEDEKIPREVCRDVPGEFRISRLITRYFEFRENETGDLVIRDDEDRLYRLLDEGMSRFRELGEVTVTDEFRRLRVIPSPRVSMGVSVESGWLDLSVDAEGMSGNELLKVLSEYRQKKKYYRTGGGGFVSLRNEGLKALADLMDGLALSKTSLASGKLRLPSYRAFYLDSLIRENGHVRFNRDEAFGVMVRAIRSAENISCPVPEELSDVLREYQKEGFSWMKTLDQYGFGGILADDMGLGKTIQVIALLASYHLSEAEKEKSPSLVVCPASLVYNWGHECSVFAPSLKVCLVTGTLAERKKILETLPSCDVAVTSYDLLKRDLPFYQEMEFRYEIIDEAQYIKNAATQSARAVKAVRSRTRFALTGTPVENRLSELWSIFDFLMPGFLFTYRKFRTAYEIPVVKEQSREALTQLQRMIRPFVLRRLKGDVLKELPDKLERVIYSAAEGKQKLVYQAETLRLLRELEREKPSGGGKLEILSGLMRLRQICCDPSLCYENYTDGSAKLETCISLTASAVDAGHKILLFSQFSSMLERIRDRLAKEGIGCRMLTGATPKEERNRMVASFQRDDVPVFLISLKAGGTGLNLTAADIVIHYDPWWNAAAQNQATDRAHRIGQERQVTVYKLIMKDTIEENILKLQEQKMQLADQIVTEGMVSLGQLSREELAAILRQPS